MIASIFGVRKVPTLGKLAHLRRIVAILGDADDLGTGAEREESLGDGGGERHDALSLLAARGGAEANASAYQRSSAAPAARSRRWNATSRNYLIAAGS